MTPLLPIRVDPDGIPVFRLLLSDIPTLLGLQFTKVFPNPEKFNIHSVMYFVVASHPFCIIKAHSFDIVHALSELVKAQIFLALQLLIGQISIQCTHCQCVLNNDNRRPWLNATMPRPNFSTFSNFSVSDALRVIQDNLKCPIVSKNKIFTKMAFSAELHLDRLEETIAEFRRALAQPLLVPIRVVSTDHSGISTMELLQEDLPFGSPFFSRTKVFDHPNVLSVRFLR
jgi:hypothetical protein